MDRDVDKRQELKVGDHVEARVVRVHEDGKLDLSVREKAYLQIETDAEKVMKLIDSFDGVLPFTDKASPEVIRRELATVSYTHLIKSPDRPVPAGKF